MDEKIKISIVVPMYNAENYISAWIESILKQSYCNLEIVLVDDGSKDYTLEIAKKYQKKDSRICLISKENTGVSDSRNIGIENVHGRYLTFVDSDDYLEVNCIEVLLQEIQKNNSLHMVCCNHLYDYNGKRVYKTSRLKEGVYSYKELKDRLIDDGTLTGILFGSVCGVLYDLEIIRQYQLYFDKNLKVNEDGVFNLMYLWYIDGIAIIDKPLYVYRQWKEKKIFLYPINTELDKATEKILQFYTKKDVEYVQTKEFKRQMAARKVSVIFWKAFQINNTYDTNRICLYYLDELFHAISKKEYMALNQKEMGIYKKIIVWVMKKRWKYIFLIGIRFVYNPFKSYLKRI